MESIIKAQRKSESNLRQPSQEQLTNAHARNGHAHSAFMPSSSNSFDLPRSGRPPTEQRKRTFSILRLRNASDPNLYVGHRLKEQRPKKNPPPELIPPTIITTSPTLDTSSASPTKSSNSKEQRLGLIVDSSVPGSGASSSRSSLSSRQVKDGVGRKSSSMRMSRVTFDEPERASPLPSSHPNNGLPPYEDIPSLPIPPPRLSESSRSTTSSAEQIACTTTTTHTVSTTTTFWKISRRKKGNPQLLFPLPDRVERQLSHATHEQPQPNAPLVTRPKSMFFTRSSSNTSSKLNNPTESQNAPATLAASALGIVGPASPLLRSNSNASIHSSHSSPTPDGQRMSGISRGRSLTVSATDPSTPSRSSFSSIFRFRRDSEPVPNGYFTRTSSPQPYNTGTMPSSVVASKERLIIPERHDEDTPQMYLARLKQAVSKSVVASLLAKSDDAFHVAVLKAYMLIFRFYDDPMDMALRKLLMEAELPREAQQIDRVLQAFADRYHECNPQIFTSSEQAYFIAFSLLILHTDAFNKNNKRKMQKTDYVKNTQVEGITTDILECFYQNITYTPFIHVEDDLDINGEKIVPQKPKRSIFSRANSDGKRNLNTKEPIDPYLLIIENRLDLLRPSLKDVLDMEDPYNYLGTAKRLDIPSLHRAFFRYAVLQIVSPRSRPDAFLSPTTVANPLEAEPGLVDLKITKVGVLWRKDAKKKRMRDPWQEWGAMLTGSKLYFFRNVSWIKSLVFQYEQHQKDGNSGTPVVFKPPLETFKPDAELSTDRAVALLDRSYKRHKHAFAFVKHDGMLEYFLADSEADMNDWLAKLNYAATFRTAGVRMRGVVGGHYEGQRSRGIRRMDSTAAQVVDSPSGEVSIRRGNIDQQLATEILNARRQVIHQKLIEFNERLLDANNQLEAHLRNAKHLTILAPIQQKTREQAMLAAGSLAAKLKWVRLEIWKLKCHRDILLFDIEDEKRHLKEQARRTLIVSTTRRPSKASACSSGTSASPTRSPEMSNSSTPTQANFNASASNSNDASSSSPNAQKTSETWEIPPLAFDKSPRNSLYSVMPPPTSANSLVPAKSDAFETAASGGDTHSIETAISVRSQSPVRSEDDFSGDPEKEIEKEREKGKKESGTGPKIKRGLQKTLRGEVRVPTHKGKKSRDFSSEFKDISEREKRREKERDKDKDKDNTEGEVLPRSTGSFTVHGKKASVITFGSEWNSMSPEERLRLHKPMSPSAISSENKHSLTPADSSSVTAPDTRGSLTILAPSEHNDKARLEEALEASESVNPPLSMAT